MAAVSRTGSCRFLILTTLADPLTDGYSSLSRNINKVDGSSEIPDYELLPELKLTMDDDELISLKKQWMKLWEPYSKEIEAKQLDNERYWLGQQFTGSAEKRPLVDNLIFESLETFLPIATRPKADPVVESDGTERGQYLADKVRKMLIYQTDILAYNLKIKQVARYWALYLLGVLKVGWSMKENDITCVAIRPQKLILDPTATVEECEYTGGYIGEHLEDTAANLVLRFPKKSQFIRDKVQDRLGTKVPYMMWSTPDYTFWTLDDEVLAKNKNPHWNYPTKQAGPMDEIGVRGPEQTIPGKNHFKNRKMPYIFFSVFNLGKHPHDDTNLVQQNLPLQDLINKRLKQMDKNADNANNGMLVSGDAYTEKQANDLAISLRKGGVGWVPAGNPNEVVAKIQGEPLPGFIYETLVDYRNELRNVFGVRGSAPQGTIGEKTVRGKLITKGQDSDRIGGGVSTYLEQFSDNVMNWFVQLFYVYYDEPHVAAVIGSERAKEYIELSNKEFYCNLLVGVKEGSMIPHDPVTKRNEAMDLWATKGIDPITFFDRLEFPNPRESAKNLFLWLSDPIALFPDLAAQQQPKGPETRPPSESISFKDLPPEGQAQMAAKAGIQLDPMALAMHADHKEAQESQKSQQANAMKLASLNHKQNAVQK